MIKRIESAVENYLRAKRENPNFKQYRPSVQLTAKDKAQKRNNAKQIFRKELEEEWHA
jgi:hypothetical protein